MLGPVMGKLLTAFGIGSLLAIVACGGNVSGGSQDPEDSEQPETQPDPSATPSGKGGFGDANTELGPCTLGPVVYETDGAPCAWLADNRCYVERSMACNCACPRERDSQCMSGFEAGPDGHVEVYCY